MISPAWVVMMATYNAEMNRRLFGAAARLPDADRRAPRGAFFGSIHGTLSHLLWADRMWMSRFDGWDTPAETVAQSADAVPDFDALAAARAEADRRMQGWAARLTPAALEGDTAWFSGAMQRDMRRPTAMLVAHLFNHQTHHRGQVHAMLTAAGEATGATDLWLLAS